MNTWQRVRRMKTVAFLTLLVCGAATIANAQNESSSVILLQRFGGMAVYTRCELRVGFSETSGSAYLTCTPMCSHRYRILALIGRSPRCSPLVMGVFPRPTWNC